MPCWWTPCPDFHQDILRFEDSTIHAPKTCDVQQFSGYPERWSPKSLLVDLVSHWTYLISHSDVRIMRNGLPNCSLSAILNGKAARAYARALGPIEALVYAQFWFTGRDWSSSLGIVNELADCLCRSKHSNWRFGQCFSALGSHSYREVKQSCIVQPYKPTTIHIWPANRQILRVGKTTPNTQWTGLRCVTIEIIPCLSPSQLDRHLLNGRNFHENLSWLFSASWAYIQVRHLTHRWNFFGCLVWIGVDLSRLLRNGIYS
jgi:hypothetical protein